jgi:hypothetical protein
VRPLQAVLTPAQAVEGNKPAVLADSNLLLLRPMVLRTWTTTYRSSK